MSDQQTTTASSLVQDLATRFHEPQWLRTLRDAAWSTFESMPTPRLEKTDLQKRPWNFGPFPAAVAINEENHDAKTIVESSAETPVVYVRDGIVIKVNLPQHLVDKGVIFTDLHSAVDDHADLVQKYLFTAVPKDESKWTALNAALWHGGVFLYVPKHVSVEEVFHFVYAESDEGAGAMPHALVVGDEGSSFSYVDVHVSQGERTGKYVHSSVIEVIALPTAKIKAVTCNQLVSGPTHFVTRRARIEKDATVDWIFTDVGDGFTYATLEGHMVGVGSRSTSQIIGVGYGRQHLDLTALMKHDARFSSSDIKMHGVVRQKAHSTYRSCTHIVMGAGGSTGEQNDRLVIADGTARGDAIPMLLIDEHDVSRCGHAASVGKIDPTQVYYLMSRGIPQTEAMKMIIWGYLQPTVDEIPSETVRDMVVSQIERKLT